MTEKTQAEHGLYWKGGVNAAGQLVITDPEAKRRLSDAKFTVQEARELEAQDCRPVVVQVVRAFMLHTDVIETP